MSFSQYSNWPSATQGWAMPPSNSLPLYAFPTAPTTSNASFSQLFPPTQPAVQPLPAPYVPSLSSSFQYTPAPPTPQLYPVMGFAPSSAFTAPSQGQSLPQPPSSSNSTAAGNATATHTGVNAIPAPGVPASPPRDVNIVRAPEVSREVSSTMWDSVTHNLTPVPRDAEGRPPHLRDLAGTPPPVSRVLVLDDFADASPRTYAALSSIPPIPQPGAMPYSPVAPSNPPAPYSTGLLPAQIPAPSQLPPQPSFVPPPFPAANVAMYPSPASGPAAPQTSLPNFAGAQPHGGSPSASSPAANAPTSNTPSPLSMANFLTQLPTYATLSGSPSKGQQPQYVVAANELPLASRLAKPDAPAAAPEKPANGASTGLGREDPALPPQIPAIGKALLAQSMEVAELRRQLDAIRRGEEGGDPELRRQLADARKEIEELKKQILREQQLAADSF